MGATKKAHEDKKQITLRIEHLNDPVFYGALEKIDSSPVLKGPKAFAWANFKEVCDQQHKKAGEKFRELLFEHVETEPVMTLGPDGQAVPAKDKDGTPIVKLKLLRNEAGQVVEYAYKNAMATWNSRISATSL